MNRIRSFLFIVFGVLLFHGTASAQLVELPSKNGDYGPFPKPDAGYVTDHGGLLSYHEQERLERLLWQAESRTKVEIIVVTLNALADYPDVKASSIEAFATELFNAYGIGNRPANNGVLLLVAFKDRKARIELGAGYGHQRDADAERIMNKVIVPCFRKEEYSKGITRGVETLIEEFAGMHVLNIRHLFASIIGIIALLLVAVSLFRNGKRGWGWVVVGLLFVAILALLRTIWVVIQHLPRETSGGWSSGGHGGFGGGSSGGGGATGSW